MAGRGTTLNRLSSRLTAISSGRVTLLAVAAFALFLVFVLPAQAELSARSSSGAGSPDQSFAYTAQDLYGWAQAYGEEGRSAYVRARWSFDLVWPLVYGAFLVTAISWVGRRAYREDSPARLSNLIPVTAVLLDYAENSLTSVVMLRYPDEATVAASLASPVTVAKWLVLGAGFVVLLAGLLVWVWRLVRRAPVGSSLR